jgi:alpha-1,2-mannosyltransferase
MGLNVFLCASVYPEKDETIRKIGIDVSDSIDGFVKAIGRNEILPFFGAYQRMTYSYFFFKQLIKKHKPDFILVTGGSTLVPRFMADKTIVYVHFPIDLEVASKRYLNSMVKRIYIKPWQFISENLDYIKRATIITNSGYTKDLIKRAWGMDATVIYPPCPQYSFPLISNQKNGRKQEQEKRQDIVCSLGRFTPEKDYETILEVAARLHHTHFDLVGSVTSDKVSYLEKLMRQAPQNVRFHVNATVQEKIDILKRSKVLLHSFVGERFGIALIEAMSAGVIPVTHDSGAAKVDGLVPGRFRYQDIEGAVASVNNALRSWNVSEAQKLRDYAKKFSAESFREKLKSFMHEWIRRIE